MKRSFDHLAKAYQLLEYMTLGKALEGARYCHLEELQNASNILILGEGDGRFAHKLLESGWRGNADIVDKSSAMLQRAKQRTGHDPRLRWFQLDVSQPAWSSSLRSRYDAIVTAFFLDCFEQPALASLMLTLNQRLSAGGYWYHVDFHEPLSGWRRAHARLWTSTLYAAFASVTDIQARHLWPTTPLFEQLHLTLRTQSRFRGDLLTAEVWQKPVPAQDLISG